MQEDQSPIEDVSSVETPQKFKKAINFEDMNNEEHSKLFWAPKKRNNRHLA